MAEEYQDYSGLLAVTAALKSAGIPFEGLSVSPVPSGETPNWINDGEQLKITVNFLTAATAQHRAQAAQIIASTDQSKRTLKGAPKLRNDIDGLSSAQQKALLNELLVERLRVDPQFAARLSVPLDGDEAVQRSPLKQND